MNSFFTFEMFSYAFPGTRKITNIFLGMCTAIVNFEDTYLWLPTVLNTGTHNTQ
jgi:hypothetical protein